MVRRILRQAHFQAIELRELDYPAQKLGAPTMVFRPIIEIDHQSGDVGEPQAHHLPPLDQPIDQTIAGHFGGHAIDKQFIVGRQKDAHGCDLRLFAFVGLRIAQTLI